MQKPAGFIHNKNQVKNKNNYHVKKPFQIVLTVHLENHLKP
jgi:hypothetical protein